jgi:hypothetical protein
MPDRARRARVPAIPARISPVKFSSFGRLFLNRNTLIGPLGGRSGGGGRGPGADRRGAAVTVRKRAYDARRRPTGGTTVMSACRESGGYARATSLFRA